ncbi:MAG: tRNA (adenosine(37)-N6)-threonylcarbamoyltransferase complex dimerization subunit type 1 TsaB [Alphaproteobacteria bacterium]|nr:tRNA (adenosine(37)-N6)-threonylcarbamoyltransferase complex dimerization subunit type 1 TsaB [Alphaproteobacteria bacterium]
MAIPLILAIDTCEVTCSAALVSGGHTLARRSERLGRGHAERLLPMVSDLLAEASRSFEDLSRLVVSTGPGTFTGLRIGLSVARGLAVAKGIPCVGLMSLPVMAAQAGETGGVIHAIVMGRGGQGFYQAFEGLAPNGLPAQLGPAACLDAEVIAEMIASRPGAVVGSGASLVGAVASIDSVDPSMLGQLGASIEPDMYPPEPAYLRDADAKKGKALLPTEQ